jgi:hypothetical protein
MLATYGVKQVTVPVSETDCHAENIRIEGFTVMGNVLDASAASSLGQALDRIYETQTREIGGVERLRHIQDADVVRCPLSADSAFLEAARSPKLLELARSLLGDYFILQQQNGVINPPSRTHRQQSWHRDLPHQHFTSSRPLAVSALIFLDPFTAETGSTLVLPASHKTEPLPSESYISSHEKSLMGSPGDAAIFDSMLFHRAGVNVSPNLRRGLIQVYALPFFFQPIALSRAITYPIPDPAVRKFLGGDIEPASSPAEWRQRRFNRLS